MQCNTIKYNIIQYNGKFQCFTLLKSDFLFSAKYDCSSRRLIDKAGYLSSYVAHTRGCGSSASPWIIIADPGQIIQLELIDFSTHKHDSNIISCSSVYGFVLERSLGINQTICGSNQRQMALYTSKTNVVEIRLLRNDKWREGEFIVKYQGK